MSEGRWLSVFQRPGLCKRPSGPDNAGRSGGSNAFGQVWPLLATLENVHVRPASGIPTGIASVQANGTWGQGSQSRLDALKCHRALETGSSSVLVKALLHRSGEPVRRIWQTMASSGEPLPRLAFKAYQLSATSHSITPTIANWPKRQLPSYTRRRKGSKLARPCIWRFRSFRRSTCPSVSPLLQGS
jgi:hypothetical protein